MTKIHKRGRYSAALKEKVSLEALKGKHSTCILVECIAEEFDQACVKE